MLIQPVMPHRAVLVGRPYQFPPIPKSGIGPMKGIQIEARKGGGKETLASIDV